MFCRCDCHLAERFLFVRICARHSVLRNVYFEISIYNSYCYYILQLRHFITRCAFLAGFVQFTQWSRLGHGHGASKFLSFFFCFLLTYHHGYRNQIYLIYQIYFYSKVERIRSLTVGIRSPAVVNQLNIYDTLIT